MSFCEDCQNWLWIVFLVSHLDLCLENVIRFSKGDIHHFIMLGMREY